MTVKYFTAHTSVPDLYLVCYRFDADNGNGSVEICETFATFPEAKAKANLLNADDLLHNVTDFTGNIQNIDDAIKLYETANKLTMFLFSDLGVYTEQRKRREAAEAAKETTVEQAAD